MDTPTLYEMVRHACMFLHLNGSPTADEKAEVADWILQHQNRQDGFIFFPTPLERQRGIHLFTGETARTKLLQNNAMELETLRLLAVLQPEAPAAQQIFQEANQRLFTRCFANGCTAGECAHAQIALARYLTALDFQAHQGRILRTLSILKEKRAPLGRWDAFPLYYTVLWLSELPADLAREHLIFILPKAEGLLKRRKNGSPVDTLRRSLLKTTLRPLQPQAASGGAARAPSRAGSPTPPPQRPAR